MGQVQQGQKATLSLELKFDGQEKLGKEVLKWGNLVNRVQIDQRLDCPDYFAIDMPIMGAGESQEKDFKIINDVKLGMKVEVSIGYGDVGKVFVGEISYIEPSFRGTDARVTVAGYDYQHRLTRGTSSKTFGDGHKLTENFGDVATKVIGDAKARMGNASHSLSGDSKAASSKAEYLSQIEVSDYQFLESLGIAGQVRDSRSGDADKKVTFKPVDPTSAPVLFICHDFEDPDKKKGRRPESAEFSLSTVRQVARVEVRGWDVKTKKAFVGKCEAVSAAVPSAGKPGHKAAGAAHFGGEANGPVLTIIDRPVYDKAEAEELAKAIFNSLAMQYLKAEIVCEGTPTVKPGDVVEVKQFSKRFNGKYVVEAVSHVVDGAQADTMPYVVRLSLFRNAAEEP